MQTKRTYIKNNWVAIIVAITLIVLPLSLKFNLYLLFALGAIGVYSIARKRRMRFNRPFELLCALFFALHLYHVFLDSNSAIAWFETEKKFSFLVLPIVIFNLPFKIKSEFHKITLLLFSYGLFLVGLFLLVNGILDWIDNKNILVFYYHEFVAITSSSAIYMSLMFCISNCILLKYNKDKNKVWHLLIVLFNCGILLLLMSKMFVILNVLIILLFLVRDHKKSGMNKWNLLFSVILIVISFVGLLSSNLKSRYLDIINSNSTTIIKEEINETTHFNGLNLRVLFWEMGLEIMSENKGSIFFGLGPGDCQDLLNEKIRARNMYVGTGKVEDTGYLNYNFHNQYIQTFMEVGVIGLLLLLLLFGVPITHAIRTRKYLLLAINLVFFVAFFTESYLSRQIGVVSFLTFNSILLSSSFKRKANGASNIKITLFLKYFYDFVFSILFILFVLSWFIPLIFIVVLIDTRSFPLFSQKRVGQHGEVFYCYKLRTMRKNVEADKLAAQLNDQRITLCGKFFRKYGIDELPQIFNVLKGEMSLVGPRPLMINDEKHFNQMIPDFSTRLKMKPGITGLSQSKGYKGLVRNESDINRRYILDKFYGDNFTLKFDFIIMFNTIFDIVRIKKNNV